MVERRIDVAHRQKPFAMALACADSRVPVEHVFDQSVGDIFVCRVAGNILAPSILGSLEFAASAFGSAALVVLCHERCGAIESTLALLENGGTAPGSIQSIVDAIEPAVRATKRGSLSEEEYTRRGDPNERAAGRARTRPRERDPAQGGTGAEAEDRPRALRPGQRESDAARMKGAIAAGHPLTAEAGARVLGRGRQRGRRLRRRRLCLLGRREPAHRPGRGRVHARPPGARPQRPPARLLRRHSRPRYSRPARAPA